MIRYDEAIARTLAAVAPLPAVSAPPLRALGLFLAGPLAAPGPLPPFDDAAMDGFAVRAERIAGASREAPARLGRGEAFRVATGDAVPAWADTVVQQELCRADGDAVLVLRALERGANVRRRGEDVEAGAVVAPAGARVDATVALAAAALGLERVRVVRRVRAAVLPVGRHLAQGRPDATGPGVVATLRSWGVAARLAPPATGDAAAVAARIAALRADVVVTCGAASVGEDDVVPAALGSLGSREVFHGVSIKPGKPLGLHVLGGRPALLLPGSPVAALAGLEGVGRALFARLMGDPAAAMRASAALEFGGGAAGDGAGAAAGLRADDGERAAAGLGFGGGDHPGVGSRSSVAGAVLAFAGAAIERRRGKVGLLRGELVARDGRLEFFARRKQGPSQVAAVACTNAVAVLPPDAERVERGAPVEVIAAAPPRPAARTPVVAVCGWSGAGKTHLVAELVRRLTARGLRVATVKHDVHGFEPDPPGKDTSLHRAAGAVATALAGPGRTMIVREGDASLEALAARVGAGADLVLAEGFKHDRLVPKIELAARGRERIHAAPLLALVEADAAPTDAQLDELERVLLGLCA